MAQSSIITGQYVELTQTPASVGDRLIAALIDYAILTTYSTAIISVSETPYTVQVLSGAQSAHSPLESRGSWLE